MGEKIVSDIETKVDNLIGNRLSKASVNHKKKRNTIKALKGNLFLLGVVLIGLTLASGSLFILYSSYHGKMQGNINMNGIESKLLFDSVRLTTQDFEIPMDITELTNGDSETFVHTFEIESDSMFDYDLSFDYSNMSDIFLDPENPFYGFEFDVQVDSVSILDTVTTVEAGTILSMDFIYTLHEDFMNTIEDLPFELEVILTETLPPVITANDDSYSMAPDTAFDCYAMDNDVCDNDMLIISVDNVPSELTVFVSGPATGHPLGSYIRVQSANPTPSPSGEYSFTYTIEDQITFDTDTATVTITVT